eukprot:scaffold13607_cov35-Tisochrysis_lutea.AAC.8
MSQKARETPTSTMSRKTASCWPRCQSIGPMRPRERKPATPTKESDAITYGRSIPKPSSHDFKCGAMGKSTLPSSSSEERPRESMSPRRVGLEKSPMSSISGGS